MRVIPSAVRRRPAIAGAAVIVVAGAVAAGVYWFEPQKLVIDETVDEAAPGAARPGDPSGAGRAPDVKTIGMGSLKGLEHSAAGTASLLELDDGTRFLRFEKLNVENGPDLRVYLTPAGAGSSPDTFDDDFVDLGDLKGNVGNQNYPVPASVDVSSIKSAVIWCRRFSVGFAVASLE